jgi:hypothetical protein
VDLQTIGRAVVVLGISLAIAGGLLWLGGRMGLGSLPGDIKLNGQGFSCGVPIATSILLSLLLTIVLNILWRLFGR